MQAAMAISDRGFDLVCKNKPYFTHGEDQYNTTYIVIISSLAVNRIDRITLVV